MENTMFSGQQAASAASAGSATPAPSAAYDFRVYDQVWQRVTPGVNPYAEDAAAPTQGSSPASPVPAVQTQTMSRQENEGNLPGAIPNPCCMGTNAQDSVEVLEGFIQEELAGSRCCQSLSGCIRNQSAVQLLRRIASEKQAAAREMCGACYLITGVRYSPSITVQNRHWGSLAEALRSCYHQEACNGLNYARAADETTDPCLTKLFNRLSEQSYRQAEDVMSLLGKIIC